MSAPVEMEHDRYFRVVAMSADGARKFAMALLGRDPGRAHCFGQADPTRYRFGARDYGFRTPVPGCKCKGCRP